MAPTEARVRGTGRVLGSVQNAPLLQRIVDRAESQGDPARSDAKVRSLPPILMDRLVSQRPTNLPKANRKAVKGKKYAV